MMSDIFETLKQQLQENQFLSGGALLMAAGALVHQCRRIPARIFHWVSSRCVITIDILSNDQAFTWISAWLSEQNYSKRRARNLRITSIHDDDGTTKFIMTPSEGTHWFFYKKRLVKLSRGTKEDGNGKSPEDSGFMKPEQFHLTIFTRDRVLVASLLREAQHIAEPNEDEMTKIMSVAKYGMWSHSGRKFRRRAESVVLKDGVMEHIEETIKKFLESKEWYLERGIPYRLGILLSGPPGSGKSSAVAAICGEFNMGVGVVSLSGKDMDDNKLRDSLSEVPARVAVLVEDIDCVFVKREGTKDKDNNVTFSGLLNAVDGVAAGEGRILFMTTNHPEKLDPALLRPGRVDLHLKFEAPDASQRSRLYKRFFPDSTRAEEFAEKSAHLESMAAVQGHLIAHAHDADDAVDMLMQPETIQHLREILKAG